MRGFRDFVITELSEKRRTAACNLGLGAKVVHPDQLHKQYLEARRNKNDDWGFDVIVDCTGSPKAIEQEFLYTRKGRWPIPTLYLNVVSLNIVTNGALAQSSWPSI